MKKRNQLLVLCALAVLVLTVFACENPFIPGKYKEPAPPQAPSISVAASPIGPYIKGEGLTITATAKVGDAGELSYQWYSNTKNSSSGGTKISGATGESYRPSTDMSSENILEPSISYYYVEATNTLNGRSTTASSRTVDVTVYDVGTDTPIREVNVTVVAPVKGASPSDVVSTEVGYSLVEMEWDPWTLYFQERHQYTVTVKIQADNGYTLIALRSAKINGHAATINRIDGNTVELSVKFAEMKGVEAMEVKTQPSNMTYVHGNALSLNGLVVMVTYSDGTTEDVAVEHFEERDIITNPAHSSAVSYTNHNGNPIEVSHAGVKAYTNNLNVSKAVITAPDVFVVGPLRGETPHTTTTVDSNENYISSAVSWTPAPVNNEFQGSIQYTATVTLTVKSGDYVFASGGALNAKISGLAAAVSDNTGTSITVSYQFVATLDKMITDITVTNQPSTLTYTHRDTLSLDGLEVTVTYEGATDTEVVPFAEFASKNITTYPANGMTLIRMNHNGMPVQVNIGGLSAPTNQLVVNAKELTITGAVHSKVYDGNTGATGISSVTFTGTIGDDEAHVSVQSGSVTAAYTSADAGTKTMQITAINLTGTAAGNYTVVVPSNTFTTSGNGIIKATVTVTTWPLSGTTINYGQMLSASTLNRTTGSGIGINGTSVSGTFAWTNPNSVPTGGWECYSVTFTPTSVNYNTAVGGEGYINRGNGSAEMCVNPQVTFVMNGATSAAIPAQIITYDGTVSIPADPTRTNYTFGGWYTDSAFTTLYNGGAKVTKNYTLYARWISNSNITTVTNVTNSASNMAMVFVGGGTFTMLNGWWTNRTMTATLSNFYIGKYEVTQEQYQTIMGVNPSGFSSSPDTGETQGKRPVEKVGWYDAVEFCNKLSEAKGLTKVYTISSRTPASGYPITGLGISVDLNANGYRLPTEAEWLYAARGGRSSIGYNYAGSNTAGDVAWIGANSNSKTHEVGKKTANELGIYDMSGNVAELCENGPLETGREGAYVNPDRGGIPSFGYMSQGASIRGGTYAGTAPILYGTNSNYVQSSSGQYQDYAGSIRDSFGFRVARNAP